MITGDNRSLTNLFRKKVNFLTGPVIQCEKIAIFSQVKLHRSPEYPMPKTHSYRLLYSSMTT